jgi:hypothetical protein
VDVIIEGKITQEEGIDEVLKTCAEIKSVKTPILRINDNGSELQGQIAFSQGGYIIGGKVNQTNEIGYTAVRRLLMIEDGNYAILDPLRKHITDVNQSLWLKVDKVVALLPNLPENPDGLLDKQPEVQHSQKAGQVDLGSNLPMSLESSRVEDEVSAPPVVATVKKSKARKFNLGMWRIAKAGLAIIVGFTAVLYGVTYFHQILAFLKNLLPH